MYNQIGLVKFQIDNLKKIDLIPSRWIRSQSARRSEPRACLSTSAGSNTPQTAMKIVCTASQRFTCHLSLSEWIRMSRSRDLYDGRLAQRSRDLHYSGRAHFVELTQELASSSAAPGDSRNERKNRCWWIFSIRKACIDRSCSLYSEQLRNTLCARHLSCCSARGPQQERGQRSTKTPCARRPWLAGGSVLEVAYSSQAARGENTRPLTIFHILFFKSREMFISLDLSYQNFKMIFLICNPTFPEDDRDFL